MSPESSQNWKREASYSLPRGKATLFALGIGVLLGFLNLQLGLDFTLRPILLAWLAGAVVVTASLHEGVHGLVAILLGHRPIFGLKPPLVYVTFDQKVGRNSFVLIALAPLILLDILFGALYYYTPYQIFWDLCFSINTLGAVGDLWMVFKLLSHSKSAMVQDTKDGFEVWNKDQ